MNMSLLFRLVYATHANGTHHKLAMDALRHLECENAIGWQRLILKHSELYLEGAKAPDKEFKDFKNHVLHVRDNFWGGAPEKATNWYNHLVTAIKSESWEEAVYAAGVLSHYYTDPIEPLHTAQCEAENNIHRAVEWSISKSYAELRKMGAIEFADLKVEAGTGDDWIGDMVRAGATTSNAYYEKLITHYDVHKGVVHPPEGLDDNSRKFVAMLLRYAATGFAKILDRAFEETGATPPKVALTPQTFLATLKIPVRWVTNKLEDAAEQKEVQAMYDELQATGTVEKTLDEDERTIRELHSVEVLGRKPGEASSRTRSSRTASKKSTASAPKPSRKKKQRNMTAPKSAIAATAGAAASTTAAHAKDKIDQQAKNILDRMAEKLAPTEGTQATDIQAVTDAAQNAAPTEFNHQFYLSREDNVVDAPSIGRKTAKKLNRFGIFRVSDLLAADPDELSEDMNLHYINAETIIDWQDQARLCCDIPRLRGGHAQILIGGGFRDANEIAISDPRDMHPDIAAFCETEEGQRINRSGETPTLTEIGDWISGARSAKLERAA